MKMNKKLISLILAMLLICMGALGLAETTAIYYASDAADAQSYPVPDVQAGDHSLLTPEQCGFIAPSTDMEFDSWVFYMEVSPGEWVHMAYFPEADFEYGAKTHLSEGKQHKFVANWRSIAKDCTITFDYDGGYDNGGPTPAYSGSYDAGNGEYIQLPPARVMVGPDGWVLSHWMVDGETYEPHAWYQVTGDATVTAVWADPATIWYTVELVPNIEGNNPIEYSSNPGFFTLPAISNLDWNVPDGKIFDCWRCNGENYQPGDQIQVSDHLSIRANWLNGYVVHFDNTYATGGEMEDQLFLNGATNALSKNAFEREAAGEFVGWTAAVPMNNGMPEYTDEQMICPTSNLTLYPVWEQTLSVDPDNGVDEPRASSVYLHSEGVYGTPADWTFQNKAEHDFVGWRNSTDEEDVIHTADEALIITGNTELTAVWEKNTFRVTFDKNSSDAVNTMEKQVYNKGVEQYLHINNFERQGYAFTGWNTASDGSGDSYQNQQWISIDQDITLYAQWKEIICQVSFSSNPGNPNEQTPMDPVNVQAGQSYMLPACTMGAPGPNYEFLYWEINGQSYDAGKEIQVTGNIEAIARWKTKTYTVIYQDGQGNTLDTLEDLAYAAKLDVKHPDDFKLTAPNGMVFKCWDVYEDGSLVDQFYPPELFPEGEYRVLGNYTLVPNWVASGETTEYTVTYSLAGGQVYDGANEKWVTSWTYDLAAGEEDQVPPADKAKGPNNEALDYWMVNGERVEAGGWYTVTGETTITAVWKSGSQTATCTVTFVLGDEADGTMEPIKVNAGDSIRMPDPGDYAKEEYRFLHWTIGEQILGRNDMYTVSSDVTAYAHWELMPVKLHYADADGNVKWTHNGTFGDEHTVLPHNHSLVGLTAPEGYAFGGWKVYNSMGIELNDVSAVVGQVLKLEGFEWTLKPIWVAVEVTPTYTVTIDPGEGTGEIFTENLDEGDELTPGGPAVYGYSKEGHTFLYWQTDKGEICTADGSITVTGNVTLTAIWAPIPVTEYQITFDKSNDDATGTMEPVTVEAGEEFTVPECGFTAAGDVFTHWSDGVKDYEPGDKITVNGDLRLMARWTVRTVSLVYQDENGVATGKKQSGIQYGETIGTFDPETAGLTVPQGKRFGGWKFYNTDGTDAGRTIAYGESFVIDNDWLLRPIWIDIQMSKVTFDANGAEGTMEPVSVETGKTYTLPACGFMQPIYENFIGWEIDGVRHTAGSTITVSSDLTAKAVWEHVQYTITFDANVPDISLEPVQWPAGFDYTLPKPEEVGLDVEGLNFKGWLVNGEAHGPGYTFAVTSDVEVTARWEVRMVTLKYQDADGNDVFETDPVRYGTDHIVLAPKDAGLTIPDGRDFLGWKVYNNMGGEIEIPAETGKPMTLYSDWLIRPVWSDLHQYTVSFSANGGSGSMATVSLEHGATYLLPECGFTAPAGHEFIGWTIDGVDYQPSAEVLMVGSLSVKADWAPIDVEITYMAGSQGWFTDVSSVKDVQKYGVAFRLPKLEEVGCNYSADDSVFLGWSVNGKYLGEGDLCTVYGDTTITAMWADMWYTFAYMNGYDNTRVNSERIRYGTSLTLPSPSQFGLQPKEYHTFAYWEVGGKAYQPGQTISYSSSDKSITAMWIFDETQVEIKVEETPVEVKPQMTEAQVSEVIVEVFGEKEVEKILEALPPEITEPAQIVTVIEEAAPAEFEKETMTLQNVELMFKPEGSNEWVKATADNFPTTGITHTLAFNPGTSPATHEYMILHMQVEGKNVGKVEQIKPERIDENGVTGRFYSLSPVSLVAKAKPVEQTPVVDALKDLPETGDTSSLLGWITLLGVSGISLKAIKRRKK